MDQIQSYRDLRIWQKGMALVTEVYALLRKYPVSEQYGLVRQTQRSAVSIPGNIAEGYRRHSTSDEVRHLRISRGSLYELQTQVEIAANLKYIPRKDFETIHVASNEIAKMLSVLIKKIKSSKT